MQVILYNGCKMVVAVVVLSVKNVSEVQMSKQSERHIFQE